MTINEAKNTEIYYIQDGEVIKSNYYDYLAEFGNGDETSGVEEEERTSYVIDGEEFETEEEAEEYAEDNQLSVDLIEEKIRTFYFHVVRYHANYNHKIKSRGWESEDKEVIELEYIQGLKWYVSEKNWNAPEYFDSREEAEEYRVTEAAADMGVDAGVFLSIEKKAKKVAEIRKERLIELNKQYNAKKEAQFSKYSSIIEKIEGETYQETQARLAASLPEKIEGSVFHKIIKSIRN